MRLEDVVTRTDVGRVRDHNEDACLVMADLGVVAVADGMGGLSHGEIASATAINTLRSTASSLQTLVEGVDQSPDSRTRRQLANVMEFLTNMASERIRQTLGQGVSGTTLVIGAITRSHLLICNTGDSRAYLYRDGCLYALTEDHTVAAAQLRAGVLTPAEHDASPYQHVLYQALGTQGEVDPDLFDIPLAAGDTVLLCSDGLTGPLSEMEIERILGAHDSLDAAADALIDAANENGGPDNITLVLARAPAGAQLDRAVSTHRALASAPALSELDPSERRMLLLYLDLVEPQTTIDPATGLHLVLQGRIQQGDDALGDSELLGLLPFADPALSEREGVPAPGTRAALLTPEAFRILERRRPAIAAHLMRGLFRELARQLARQRGAPVTAPNELGPEFGGQTLAPELDSLDI